MEAAAIDFRGSTIRFLVLAAGRVRDNHEDATVRLMLQRERRKIDPEPPQEEPRIILCGEHRSRDGNDT